MEIKTIFETPDGEQFDTREAAEVHMRVNEDFKKISGLNYKNGEFVKTDYVGDALFLNLKNDDDIETYSIVAEDLGIETIGLDKPGHYMWVDNVCDGWVNLDDLSDFVKGAIMALDEDET